MPTILVVENDPITPNFIVHVLTGQGYRVFEADTAVEAVIVCDALKDRTLDLLIADHALANTSGRELAERVMQSCPKIKVLHLSVWPYSRMQEENGLVPGSSFLQKPFTGGQLTAVVQSLLTNKTQ
jgi:two-component system, cell cycle sensor histidine kinase and response regulator CckA